jgi:arginyl-tRNA synthetase
LCACTSRTTRRKHAYQAIEEAVTAYWAAVRRFKEALAAHILSAYHLEVVVGAEMPPRLSMGEIASPVCFDLAKRLKKAPRALAQEIATSLGPIEGVARIEVAGGGYLNAYLHRSALVHAVVQNIEAEGAGTDSREFQNAPKTIVEHTAINPNKAAHIGHLRNAVLGDSFARILRYAGERVEVQNYIDNTGVQVADVVLGFLHLEKKAVEEIRALSQQPKFDYLCWDLYARVTAYLEQDKTRLALRGEFLKKMEEGEGAEAEAEAAEIISTAIVRTHLRTMDRLGIDYDLLARESEILHLKFWDAAFAMLKERQAIRLAESGKNAGCWVMPVAAGDGARAPEEGATPETDEAIDEDANSKVIVRSNGTVTYVGKDIAYHLWKFGLLHRDFHYAPFYRHPDGHEAWTTAMKDGARAGDTVPEFGHAQKVYNVVDIRQAYPQEVVGMGLRAAGYDDAAANMHHLAYEVVGLTPRCAGELGYGVAAEGAKRGMVDISGRKGQGVKADDLLDTLLAAARKEVDQRHPETPEAERLQNAQRISIGALRYFLLKYTRGTAIAFDFHDALNFEGETGPYCLYAVVRARGIFKKESENAELAGVSDAIAGLTTEALLKNCRDDLDKLLESPAGDDLWEVILRAATLEMAVEASIEGQEPAFLAKYSFQLASAFNLFYHKHRIITEENASRKSFLLLLTRIVEKQLLTSLSMLGIEPPNEM